MKKLIVAGDSYSDLNYRSGVLPNLDTSKWKKWPEYIAEHLDMELVCLSKTGKGNEYIYSALLEYITNTPKEEIGAVMAAWTQCHRSDYQEWGLWSTTRLDNEGDVHYWTEKTIRYYLSFQLLCERYDLPYAHFQMNELYEGYIDGLGPTEDEQVFEGKTPEADTIWFEGNVVMTHHGLLELFTKYDKHINNFIGWPPIQEERCSNLYDDYFMTSKMYRPNNFQMLSKVVGDNGEHLSKYTISELDQHFNDLGNKKVAEILIQELNL